MAPLSDPINIEYAYGLINLQKYYNMLTRAIKQDFVLNWLNNDLGAPTILYSRNERILKNNVTLKKA